MKLKFFGLGKMKPYLSAHKVLFTVILVFSALSAGLSAVVPLFQSYAIDNFILYGTTDGLIPFILTYSAFVLSVPLLGYAADFGSWKLEMCLLRDMRRTAFNHLQTLSVSYFNQNSVGKIHARVMSDTSNIGAVIAWQSGSGIFQLIYFISAEAIMFSLNPLLALCVTVIIPAVAGLSVYFNRVLTRLNRKAREINSEITGGFNEGITGVETTKTLSAEDRLDSDFYTHTGEMKRKMQRIGHHNALLTSVISFASSVALALVLWYGGIITAEGVILIGTLSVFMTYAQGLMEPVLWFVEIFSELVSIKVNLERFTALTEYVSDVKDTPEVVEKYGDNFNLKIENWEPLKGDIEFKNVTFRYPDGDENILENFNLKVPAGTNVAIVGETGAGKSTLVNLVCRFFEPTEGAVLIDGRDARERSVQWLHSNIGYVLQTPHLFSGTIRENLLYGKPEATQEELDEAVKSVNAEKIIERVGYDAPVGEGGNTLSTGEKQLISFARAILADPAIFILDEATSSVDTLTEKLVQDAIEKLMKGRTSFVIAHRLSTVRNADIILVVDDGKIVESGTHTGLLKKRGVYYGMYLQQFRKPRTSRTHARVRRGRNGADGRGGARLQTRRRVNSRRYPAFLPRGGSGGDLRRLRRNNLHGDYGGA